MQNKLKTKDLNKISGGSTRSTNIKRKLSPKYIEELKKEMGSEEMRVLYERWKKYQNEEISNEEFVKKIKEIENCYNN